MDVDDAPSVEHTEDKINIITSSESTDGRSNLRFETPLLKQLERIVT